MSQQLRALSLAVQTPGCLPPLVWGGFGIGKTSRILALARALDWDVEMLRPGERGEGALGVVPVPSEARSVLEYPLPAWASRMQRSERDCLVFLDEASSTPPALQPAVMGLALDGIIAGQYLGPHVHRIAAANPVDQAAGGWELAPALANRFIHFRWPSPTVSEWGDWLMGHSEGDVDVVRLDSAAFERELGTAKALARAYMTANPSALCEEAEKLTGRFPPALATPRTWEAAVRLLAACRAAGETKLYPELATAALGETVTLTGPGGSPASAWLLWLETNDLPDPEVLLTHPDALTHDPKRPDRTFATLLAVAEAGLAPVNGRKRTEKDRGERWGRAFAVLQRGLEMHLGKDVVLLAARVLCERSRRPKCPLSPAALAVTGQLELFIENYSV